MDQRSGDGWFFGWAKILTITKRERFSGFWDAGREDCLGSEQDHPEFPVQKKGQPRGAESPKRGSYPERTIHTSEDRPNQGTIPMLTFATKPLTTSFTMPVELPQSYMVGQQRQQISELQFDKFPTPQIVFGVENSFQKSSDYTFWLSIGCYVVDQGSGDGRFSGWIKNPRDQLQVRIPRIFELLDARIASALNKIIQNSQFKKKVSLQEQKAQKEDLFLRGRQIALMIHDYFRVTGARDTVLECAVLFSVILRDDNFQDFDTRWDEILLSLTKIPSDDVLGSLYKLRIRESDHRNRIVRHGDSSEAIDFQ